jgi:hypothetical protein
MPFAETMKDIWRIVVDTGISTIVMMNTIDDTYEVRYLSLDETKAKLLKPFTCNPFYLQSSTR